MPQAALVDVGHIGPDGFGTPCGSRFRALAGGWSLVFIRCCLIKRRIVCSCRCCTSPGCSIFSLLGCTVHLMLSSDLLRQLFSAAQRGTDSRFCCGSNRIHGTFLLSRCFLILPIPVFLRDKPPGAFAGAQPDGVHGGSWQAGFVCCVYRLACRFLFRFYHIINRLLHKLVINCLKFLQRSFKWLSKLSCTL